jgi:tetratricopeptide (TPR) repeat protein
LNRQCSPENKFVLTCKDDSIPRNKAEHVIDSFGAILPSPENIVKIFARAIMYAEIQNYNKALDDYSRIIEMNPKYSLAYFNRANIRYEMESFTNSIDDYSNVIIYLDKSKSPKQHNQQIKTHDYDDVISDYSKCIQIDPEFYYAYYNIANVKTESRDFIGAINYYSKAIEIEPKFAEAYYNRGITYIYIQQKEDGCIDLSRAGELGVKRAYVAIKRFCD